MKLVLVLIFAVATATAVQFDEDLDWYNAGIFYQIYPRSFKDSNGDGIGDINGIIEKLDYLHELGITAILLGPIFKSPMIDGGYDIENYFEVDSLFGSNADLDTLISEAHEKGIKVVIDYVPNHTSDQHEWFQRSVNRFPGYEDFYIWRNCGVDAIGQRLLPNNWISVYHTFAWTYNSVRDQCYLHQFTREQPDLNFRNERVQEELKNVFKYWLSRGVDGFRVDNANRLIETANYPSEVFRNPNGDRSSFDNLFHTHTVNRPESYEFVFDLRKIMDDFVDHASADNKTHKILMTAGTTTTPEQIIAWYGEDENRRGAHIPFNPAFTTELNRDSNANEFLELINHWLDAKPIFGVEPNWLLSNHDTSRIGFRFGDNRHESLAMITMMLPGIKTIYYGEEIRMTDNRAITFEQSDDPIARNTNSSVFLELSRDPARTPFQWDNTINAGFSNTTTGTWLPVNANFQQLNLRAQELADKSTYKLYKRLIQLNNERLALKIGNMRIDVLGDYVLGFMRVLRGHNTIVVIANLGADATTANLKDLMTVEFSGRTRAYYLAVATNTNYEIGWQVPNVENITLSAYETLVLEVSSATKISMSLLLIVCSLFKFIF